MNLAHVLYNEFKGFDIQKHVILCMKKAEYAVQSNAAGKGCKILLSNT